MNILIATPLYPPETDKSAEYSSVLAEQLHNQGNTVSVITFANNPLVHDSFSVYSVQKSHTTIVRLFLFTLKLFVLVPKSDLVFVQEIRAAGLPAVIVSKILRKPVLVHAVVEEVKDKKKSALIRKIVKFVLTQANVVIVSSQAARDFFIKDYNINPTKFEVIYDPLPREEKLPFKVLKNSNKIVVSVSEEDKNFQQVLDVGTALRKSHPELQIHLLNKTTIAEEQYHISSARLHVLVSSDNFNFANTFFSLSKKVPMIIYKDNPVAELVSSGMALVINNIDELQSAIEKYLDTTPIDKIEQGYSLAKDKLSWDSHLQRLNNITKSL